MSVKEVIGLVGESNLNFKLASLSKPGKKYLVHIYVILSGQVETPYICAYENEKLIYWGYPWEFNRHLDPVLNEIGAAGLAAYDNR